MSLHAQVTGLNEFLWAIYGSETRLSFLLADLAFSPEQVERLRKAHAEYIVASFISLMRERVLLSSDGERLYQVICRRFGLDGDAPETLHSLGQRMGISRERVRQLQQKALRRCKHRAYRKFWEEGVHTVASDVVGAPQGGVILPPLARYQRGGSTNQSIPDKVEVTFSKGSGS